MKRNILKLSAVVALMFSAETYAQTLLPNGDFESWTTSTRDTLVGWKGTLGVQKVTGKGGTGFAAKVATTSVSDIASLISGNISCITGCSGQIKGTGIPLNGATGALSIKGDFASSANSPIVAIAFFDANGVLMSGGVNGYYGGILPGQPTLTTTTVSTFISSATVPFPQTLNVPSGAASMILGFFPEISSLTSPTSAKTVGSYVSIDNLSLKVGTTSLTVPNADFENWSTIVTDMANGWNSSETYMTGSLSKSTDKNSGTYAAKISTGTFVGNTQTGVLSYGTVQYGTTEAENIYSPKLPLAGYDGVNTHVLRFFSKYTPSAGIKDTAEIEMIFTKRVGNVTQKVAIITQYISPSESFVANDLAFGNVNYAAADSVIVQFYSSRGSGTVNRGVGSMLLVDNVQFLTSAGLIDNSINLDVNVYPNPTQSLINIVNSEKEDLTIEVRDLSGKELSSTLVKADSNLKFDLSNYPKGLYLLDIYSSKGVLVKKLVIE